MWAWDRATTVQPLWKTAGGLPGWYGRCARKPRRGVHQVHSPDVVAVEIPFDGDRLKADAMVSDPARPPRSGRIDRRLRTRCCFPYAQAGVIGAAHAGWKGCADGRAGEHGRPRWSGSAPARRELSRCSAPPSPRRITKVGPEFRRAVSRSGRRQRPDFFAPTARDGPCAFRSGRGYTHFFSPAAARFGVTGFRGGLVV